MGPGPGLRWDGMCKGLYESLDVKLCTAILTCRAADEKLKIGCVNFPYEFATFSE